MSSFYGLPCLVWLVPQIMMSQLDASRRTFLCQLRLTSHFNKYESFRAKLSESLCKNSRFDYGPPSCPPYQSNNIRIIRQRWGDSGVLAFKELTKCEELDHSDSWTNLYWYLPSLYLNWINKETCLKFNWSHYTRFDAWQGSLLMTWL